eukprot:GDKK01008607.1.p1 GENE.GDKK01008607.1~~GDKK01008607.1.p1  ORF type:complete len:104 (+),score=9.84 GDKK01008607.1:111-422(+)
MAPGLPEPVADLVNQLNRIGFVGENGIVQWGIAISNNLHAAALGIQLLDGLELRGITGLGNGSREHCDFISDVDGTTKLSINVSDYWGHFIPFFTAACSLSLS